MSKKFLMWQWIKSNIIKPVSRFFADMAMSIENWLTSNPSEKQSLLKEDRVHPPVSSEREKLQRNHRISTNSINTQTKNTTPVLLSEAENFFNMTQEK